MYALVSLVAVLASPSDEATIRTAYARLKAAVQSGNAKTAVATYDRYLHPKCESRLDAHSLPRQKFLSELGKNMVGPEKIRLWPEVQASKPIADAKKGTLTFATMWVVTGTDHNTGRPFRFEVPSSDVWARTSKGYQLLLQLPRKLPAKPATAPTTGQGSTANPQ